jgi:hypothetical protein
MYSQSLLVSALLYETAKRDGISAGKELLVQVGGRIMALAEWYDRKYPEQTVCTGNIMCLREGSRHKQGCAGRVEPFHKYTKGLTNA